MFTLCFCICSRKIDFSRYLVAVQQYNIFQFSPICINIISDFLKRHHDIRIIPNIPTRHVLWQTSRKYKSYLFPVSMYLRPNRHICSLTICKNISISIFINFNCEVHHHRRTRRRSFKFEKGIIPNPCAQFLFTDRLRIFQIYGITCQNFV